MIPKSLRDTLGIHSATPLNIVLQGKGIYISLIQQVVGDVDEENTYLKILEKTRGSWGRDSEASLHKQRKAQELAASKERKKVW